MPVSPTDCGLPPALSVNFTVPVRLPAAVGVKVTLIVQFAPAATLDPHVLVSAKSPEAAIWVIESAALPELVKVTTCAALGVPTSWLLNVKLDGDKLTAGAPPEPPGGVP